MATWQSPPALLHQSPPPPPLRSLRASVSGTHSCPSPPPSPSPESTTLPKESLDAMAREHGLPALLQAIAARFGQLPPAAGRSGPPSHHAALIGLLMRWAPEHEHHAIRRTVRAWERATADFQGHDLTPQRTSCSYVSADERLLSARDGGLANDTSPAGLQADIRADLAGRLRLVDCDMGAALGPAIAPRQPGTLRVLQWNILADGLSRDGFCVSPVVQDWPCDRGLMPTADGSPPVPVAEVIEQILGVTADISRRRDEALATVDQAARDEVIAQFQEHKNEALAAIKERFDTEAANDNLNRCIDWDGRVRRMRWLVASIDPDIITFQEMDRLADTQKALDPLGYECSRAQGQLYRPRHILADYMSAVRDGIAFAPKVASEALIQKLERMVERDKLSEACDLMMGQPLGQKPWKTLKSLLRDAQFAEKGGFSAYCAQLVALGVPEAVGELDDDGVAVFWRKQRFACEGVEVLGFGGGQRPGVTQGAVKVVLRDTANDKRLSVITAHLSSGNRPEQEASRIQQLRAPAPATDSDGPCAGLLGWLEHAARTGPVLLAMDANSRPQFPGPQTVWRACKEARLSSVWDRYFAADGTQLREPAPVTVNKLRGPGSAQPQKIGEHAFELIDHLFAQGLAFRDFALSPTCFGSKQAALSQLLPSLAVPSDHYPVAADFEW
eukprot:TRINITY_DN50326_c0_g1_i1.p1 TRINITY_DN50326_c0_g1~~TRINITY_DN50326_c0_g1_i1.p1  ORF type:complete len:701 (+),score=208.04 TRINITY_DN50326_c0_g1_i1:85-2103(+)